MRTIVPTQEVWFVSGCEEGYLFETKLDAEIYARKLFPDERVSISKLFMNLRRASAMKMIYILLVAVPSV
jgi:hypothetical protein